MLHDSNGERRVQVVAVVRGACHLSCAVTVLDARRADLVKYLNWFVDLMFAFKFIWDVREMKERERERER